MGVATLKIQKRLKKKLEAARERIKQGLHLLDLNHDSIKASWMLQNRVCVRKRSDCKVNTSEAMWRLQVASTESSLPSLFLIITCTPSKRSLKEIFRWRGW